MNAPGGRSGSRVHTAGRIGRMAGLAVALMIMSGVGKPAHAQLTTTSGQEESEPRPIILFLGPGVVFPLSHFSEAVDPMVWDPDRNITWFGDGFARWGTTIDFRAYIPAGRKIDVALDLILPRFKVQGDRFERASSIRIEDGSYFGKMLSAGIRWVPVETSWGKYFVLATAGMYQLTFDRFLEGVKTVQKGAFKDGASVGLGVEYSKWILPVEVSVRYHRFTDYANFGHGDLAWIDLAVMLGFDLTPER